MTPALQDALYTADHPSRGVPSWTFAAADALAVLAAAVRELQKERDDWKQSAADWEFRCKNDFKILTAASSQLAQAREEKASVETEYRRRALGIKLYRPSPIAVDKDKEKI